MSIKSRGNGIQSDMPLKSKERAPNYGTHAEHPGKLPQSQVDNISGYVEHNLEKTVKPRHGEHR